MSAREHRSHPSPRPAGGRAALVVTLLATAAGSLASGGAAPPDTRPDRGDGPRSPVHRSLEAITRHPAPAAPSGLAGPLVPASYPGEFRSIDGTGNHPVHTLRGAAGTPMIRMLPADYADGVSAPAGADRPGARAISNAVVAQLTDRPDQMGSSNVIWQWGQFVDHDIVETPIGSPAEALDIPVPAGDPWFDPFHGGDVVIPMDRSAGVLVDGVRQQVNHITAWIDASNVYGSDERRASALRTNDGTGRLRVSAGDLLPFNDMGLPNAPTPDDPSFFLGGDIRANEQAALTAMHTVFVREHNHWASVIAAEQPELDGEGIYLRARAIVGAEMQAITANEFLPRLLGDGGLPPYTGWDPEVDGSIANLFATGAFRVGHTLLSPVLQRIDADTLEAPEGHLSLAGAFFNPPVIIDHGVDSILRGLAWERAQAADAHVIDAVRNFLFGPPGAGGFDLASLNIQRGRDHGLPSYNAIRVATGQSPITAFGQISPDPAVGQRLAEVYEHPDDIDAWVGLLAEPRQAGAVVGATLATLIRDQFVRLRDGDRFWYQSYLPAEMVAMVEQQTLAVILRRTTGIGAELPDDVFAAVRPCPADISGDGEVGLDDILAVFAAWGSCEGCVADIDADGAVTISDLVAVLAAWGPC